MKTHFTEPQITTDNDRNDCTPQNKHTTREKFHIGMMTKACSGMARVNSGSEEMPDSSSLVRFLSELFPVARARRSAARSASMNHLDIDSCTDALIQKKIKRARQRKEVIVHKCRDYEGASAEEVKGRSQSGQKVRVEEC